ncbi:MAG: hypothetical protein D8M59_02230 [Planctomycetes bacterium]|nr:hypothetical protein [Planctomycetota bacterium]
MPEQPGQTGSGWKHWTGWLACLLLVIPALLRVCILISPDPYFDMDPRVSGALPTGIGPAGSLALDCLSLIGCTLALLASAGEHQRSPGWVFRPIITVALIIPALIYHGRSDLGNLWIGSAWLAAACTGIGAFTLARHLHFRIILIAAVMALAAPLTTKAVYQVVVEHQITVDDFAQTKDQFFRARGWAEDSAQARMYVRRLEQREASGWQPLSNVFGTIAAMLATFWVAAALTAARSKLSSGWIGVIALTAMASLAMLALTFSRGAIGAGVVGIALAGMVLLPRRWRKRVRPWTFSLTIALLVLAVVVTCLRGALLGESFTLDGYSLLFRWHYWQAGWRILCEHAWFGTGPDGFKNAYLLFKPALSPEEVADPHQVFLSWLATLGVGGVALIGLSVWGFLRQASPSWLGPTLEPGPDTDDPEYPPAARWTGWVMPLCICITVMTASALIAGEAMYLDFMVVFWPLAWVVAFLLMLVLPMLGSAGSWTSLRWASWAALSVVFLHCQIEMTLSQVGVASIIWLVLGAASAEAVPASPASSHPKPVRRRPAVIYGLAAFMGVLSISHAVLVWWPVRAERAVVKRAAEALATVGQVQGALARARQVGAATDVQIQQLVTAATILKDNECDPHIDGLMRQAQAAANTRDGERYAHVMSEAEDAIGRSMLQLDIARIRDAVVLLDQASQRLPSDPVPIRQMAKLWVTLAQIEVAADDREAARESFAVALDLVEQDVKRWPDRPDVYSFAATAYMRRFDLDLGSDSDPQRAITALEAACALDPYGLALARRYAELLDEYGNDAPRALAAYERVVLLNDLVRLDPMKQLTPKQQARVQERIEALKSSNG